VKNGVFLANEKQGNFERNLLGIQPFIAANKTKQNYKLKKPTLQEKCIVHEAIKI
jgi:hypothetical protein